MATPGKRPLTVIDFKDSAADLEGQPMPKPSEFLSAKQKDGSTLCAAEIYENVWKWLSDRGCAAIISPQLIERFAMASARWIQCESSPVSWAFWQAPHHGCSNPVTLCGYRKHIHDPGKSPVVGNLPDRP